MKRDRRQFDPLQCWITPGLVPALLLSGLEPSCAHMRVATTASSRRPKDPIMARECTLGLKGGGEDDGSTAIVCRDYRHLI